MSDEFIVPSWQDAAERSLRAYDDEHAKVLLIQDAVARVLAPNPLSTVPEPAVTLALRIQKILDS